MAKLIEPVKNNKIRSGKSKAGIRNMPALLKFIKKKGHNTPRDLQKYIDAGFKKVLLNLFEDSGPKCQCSRHLKVDRHNIIIPRRKK